MKELTETEKQRELEVARQGKRGVFAQMAAKHGQLLEPAPKEVEDARLEAFLGGGARFDDD